MPTFIYGVDPYNTADAPALNMRIVRTFNGPLSAIAYRCQQSWDFTSGSQRDKLAYYQIHGMHRLPLRMMPIDPVPAFLRRQAE